MKGGEARKCVRPCSPRLQPHFWNRIHLILYGAGERKQQQHPQKTLRFLARLWLRPLLQPPITAVMYDFHIKTAQLYCHLEAMFPFLFTGKARLDAGGLQRQQFVCRHRENYRKRR